MVEIEADAFKRNDHGDRHLLIGGNANFAVGVHNPSRQGGSASSNGTITVGSRSQVLHNLRVGNGPRHLAFAIGWRQCVGIVQEVSQCLVIALVNGNGSMVALDADGRDGVVDNNGCVGSEISSP